MNNLNSQFLVIDRDNMEQVENLALMFPKLTTLIKNNTNKNFVINFKDDRQRSLIVMVVSKSPVPLAS